MELRRTSAPSSLVPSGSKEGQGNIDWGENRMKLEKQFRAESDQERRPYRKSGETRNSRTVYSERKALESPQASKPSPASEPVQTGRQSGGNNRGLTDQLMAKVNELEKLFAQDRLHSPPDHSNLPGKETASGIPPGCELIFWDHSKESSRNVFFSMDSRGKFYERYMEKRDARLREEWRTRRAEKVMKLWALHECFHTISLELRAKFPRPAEGYKLIPGARFQSSPGKVSDEQIEYPISQSFPAVTEVRTSSQRPEADIIEKSCFS